MSKMLTLNQAVKYSSNRIKFDLVSLDNFISTDNIKQNKQGITTQNTRANVRDKVVPIVGKVFLYRLKKPIISTFCWYTKYNKPSVITTEVNNVIGPI